jgi:epoxyqueuosine reductase
MVDRQGPVAEQVDGAAPRCARPALSAAHGQALLKSLEAWAVELGFSQIGVADIDLSAAEPGLIAWLAAGFHGGMGYMAARGLMRARPAELVPGTIRVISARMDYLPQHSSADAAGWQAIEWAGLARPGQAQVSIYARGRDYHKVLRSRLQSLALRLADAVGPLGHRVFTDSAPVLEVELAQRAGLGWRGKHTLALSRDAGSMFFLGEIFVDIALPVTDAVSGHCGHCQACITVCPTQAIVAPYRLDARRCISYLTIEHEGAIPIELRRAMGNRIYGCDDCQLICPWNKFAQRSTLADFDPRPGLADSSLLALWQWDEPEFLRRSVGSAIRRIGFERWRRNLAVALGNALHASRTDGTADPDAADTADVASIAAALSAARGNASVLVREHIDWALAAAVS